MIAEDLVRIRRDLHQHPELSFQEKRTASLASREMEALGLKVKTGVGKTGVVADLENGDGPVICLRADMDALPITEANDHEFISQNPGIMHACGHDIHTSVQLGVVSVLSSIKKQLSGTVMFIFQPAEEGPPLGEKGGAELMLEEGLFDEIKPEAILGSTAIQA